MPNQQSAIKELRKTKKRTIVNDAVRATVRRDVKAARRVVAGSTDTAALLKTAAKTLAKAARKGVIHPNRAARLTSRLAKKMNAKAKTPAA